MPDALFCRSEAVPQIISKLYVLGATENHLEIVCYRLKMYPSLLSAAVLLPDSQVLGPVEELHARFEEEERKKPNDWPLHDEAYYFIMGDMPVLGDKTRIGFSNVAVSLLSSFSQEVAAEAIRSARWSLHQLLTATDAHLNAAGLHFNLPRRRVLTLVRAFHEAPWFTLNSLRLPDNKKPLDMRSTLEVASRVCLHLYVECSTVAWVRQHLPDKAEARRALRKHLENTLSMGAEVVTAVQQMFNDSRKKVPQCRRQPIDFIGPKVEKPERSMQKRFFFKKPLLLTLMLGAITVVALHQFSFQIVAISPILARLRPVVAWSLFN